MNRILLVNDSRFESMILKDMLCDIGYTVSISDEYEAIGKMPGFMPDCVVVNSIMHEITGDQLITLIKIQYPEMRCILFSNTSINSESFRYRKVDAFFKTPVNRDGLLKVLEEAWQKPKHTESAPSVTVQPPQEQAFCPHCGSRLGFESNGGFAYCPYCGKKITL